MFKRSSRIGLLLLTLASALAMIGCDSNGKNSSSSGASSSGSSSSSSSSSGAVALGNVQVHFPPPHSTTENNSILVRGIVEDATNTAQITINDQPVESEDDFATWSLRVPLDSGSNQLVIAEQTDAGESNEITELSITRRADLIKPRNLLVDTSNDRLLVLDAAQAAIVTVDRSSGDLATLSPVSAQADNLIVNPTGFTLDLASNRAIVHRIDDVLPAEAHPFVAIELTTGEQTLVANPEIEGIELRNRSRAASIAGNQAYVADTERLFLNEDAERVPEDAEGAREVLSGVVYQWNFDTDEASVVSNYDTPSADADDAEQTVIGDILSLTTHPDASVLYALDVATVINNGQAVERYRVYSIDKTSGERTLLEVNADGEAAFVLASPRSLELDYANSRLLVLDNNRIKEIDLATMDYSILAATNVPEDSDYPLVAVDAFALDSTDNNLYVADDAFDAILSVDGETGLRTWISGVGEDDPQWSALFSTPADVTFDFVNQQVFVADKLVATVFAYDLQNGTKSVLASRTVPDDEVVIAYPLSTAINANNGSLLVLDNVNQRPNTSGSRAAPRLVSVDRETGEKTFVYGYNSTRYTLNDVIFNPANNTVYTAERDNASGVHFIRAASLNGESPRLSIFSGGGIPTADNRFAALRSLTLDQENNRLLATDINLNAVLAVDLATGARTVLSGPGTAQGEEDIGLDIPQSIVIDKLRGRALVLDSAHDAIFAVDLESGARTTVYDNTGESGGQLRNPKDFDIHPLFGYVVVVDDVKDTLMAIDVVTGELVTLAR